MNLRSVLLAFLVLSSLAGCNGGRRNSTGTALPPEVLAAVTGGGRVFADPLATRFLLGTILLQNLLPVGTVGGVIRYQLLLASTFETDEGEDFELAPGEQRAIPVYTTLVAVRTLQLVVLANYVANGLQRTFNVDWTNESAQARAATLLQLVTASQVLALWYASGVLGPIGLLVLNSNLNVPQRVPAGPQEIRLYGALLFFLTQAQLLEAWGGLDGGAIFPPGQGPEGFTVAATPSAPLAEGEHCFFWLTVQEPIPLADPAQLFQYAFVVDSDANPANNWVPAPAFPADFFKDTDRWYELNYAPASGWSLRCRVVGAGNTLTTVPSGARAILSGDTLLLVVPRSEFVLANPPFRATTFAHLGDFGQNPPFTWSGDPTPTVAEGLRSWQ
jgi:hypothetical protein